ncbi:MAG: hypothetical protein Q4D04_10815 [Clostridia bacterium]|nr:hypothetical protein [Clostridia bacterium]
MTDVNIIGSPDCYEHLENEDTLQQKNDTCAIKAQQLILDAYGIYRTEEELTNLAKEKGWYEENNGTRYEHIGELLNHFGVESQMSMNGNIYDLVGELAQGHQVIAVVDSGELWNGGILESIEDMLPLGGGDHAVIISAVKNPADGKLSVQITDPGTGDVMKSYSEEQFKNAWDDSGNFMVSTIESPPEKPSLDMEYMRSHSFNSVEEYDDSLQAEVQGHDGEAVESGYGMISAYIPDDTVYGSDTEAAESPDSLDYEAETDSFDDGCDTV